MGRCNSGQHNCANSVQNTTNVLSADSHESEDGHLKGGPARVIGCEPFCSQLEQRELPCVLLAGSVVIWLVPLRVRQLYVRPMSVCGVDVHPHREWLPIAGERHHRRASHPGPKPRTGETCDLQDQ
jgi:hypothetical protein